MVRGCPEPSLPPPDSLANTGSGPREAARKGTSAAGAGSWGGMITTAIIVGAVGVAAGFTWDYVINRGK